MTKQQTAIIWRKSVYHTGNCPFCETDLLDLTDGQPIKDNLLVGVDDNDQPYVAFCRKCSKPVAFIRDYYGDKEPGLAGEWPGDE